ncbi:hypothetical protein ACJJTC_002937 [Scirpophaga incertulas]
MSNEDLLIRKRSALKAKLTNFSTYINIIKSCDKLSDLQRIELEGRLSKFDAIYDAFDVLQLEIEVLSDKPSDAYAERAAFEERYHELAAQARSLLAAASGVSSGADDSGSVASSTQPEMKYLHICSQLYNGADQRKLLQGVRRPLRRRRTDATVSSDPAPAAVTRDLRFTFKTMDHLH